MGLDPVSIGIGASVIGGALNYGEQRAARQRAGKVSGQAQALTAGGNSDIERLIQGYLTPPNQGQDEFLQYLRSNPTALASFQFVSSKAVAGLQANHTQNIPDQE